jgi:hypothetical protein
MQSDPRLNPNFSRAWTPPPPKRKRPASGPTDARAKIESSTDAHTTFGVGSAQRALDLADRRAAQLERRAETLASLGLRVAALRIAALAGELREVTALPLVAAHGRSARLGASAA